ncbi:MAG: hypothetical protein D6742_01275 [Cyanobacteria bacterium J069]|nr:MAG: hypothetical protein D6742_01275 [Cyanobacteria bacterium J069]
MVGVREQESGVRRQESLVGRGLGGLPFIAFILKKMSDARDLEFPMRRWFVWLIRLTLYSSR